MSNLLDKIPTRLEKEQNFLNNNQNQINNQNASNSIPGNRQLNKSIITSKVSKSKTLSCRIKPELYTKLDKLAYTQSVSINQVVEHCLEEYFKNN